VEIAMSSKAAAILLLVGVILVVGCQKKQANANDAIRDAVQRHLASLKTINLGAMDLNIINVAVTGDTAQAQVEYVPKTGAPPGAGMRVSYSLEKHDQQWDVVKTNSVGGAIEHPAANVNPHTQSPPGEVHSALPNFKDLIPSSAQPATGSLPPGHPPIPPAQP
jgi:hypothetical protein